MDTTVTKTNPLGTERIGKLVLTFAVPSIISMVVNALYNIVDQIFIGQGVGYLGNGATNVVMPMTVIAIALSLLIGDGAAAYLSLKLGEGDEKSAARGVGCSISVMVIVGIILCILFHFQIVSAILLGLATGAQPIFGYNYGSGQKDRVKQAYRIILTVSTIVLILAFLVFQIAPMSIVRLFGSESELYNEFAVKCFKIFLLACPINGLQMATGVFFQAIGKPTQATILSLSRQIVYLLPATLLLPLALGVEGALWAGPLADVLAFITTLIMLKLYWKKI